MKVFLLFILFTFSVHIYSARDHSDLTFLYTFSEGNCYGMDYEYTHDQNFTDIIGDLQINLDYVEWIPGKNGIIFNGVNTADISYVKSTKNITDLLKGIKYRADTIEEFFSMEFWLKPTIAAVDQSFVTISKTDTSLGWFYACDQGYPFYSFYSYDNYLTTSASAEGNFKNCPIYAGDQVTLSTEEKTHIVVTFFRASSILGKVETYINGVLHSDLSSSMATFPFSDTVNDYGWYPYYHVNLGEKLNSESGTSYGFRGEMYLFAMYNKRLTEQNVLDNYYAGLFDSCPVAYDGQVDVNEDSLKNISSAFVYQRGSSLEPVTIKITSLPSRGSLYDCESACVTIDSIPTSIHFKNVFYQPLPNENGDEYTSFFYQACDTSISKCTSNRNITINVIPQNDPPTCIGASFTTTVGEYFEVFLNGTDIDNPDYEIIDTHVVITVLPVRGELFQSNNAPINSVPSDVMDRKVQYRLMPDDIDVSSQKQTTLFTGSYSFRLNDGEDDSSNECEVNFSVLTHLSSSASSLICQEDIICELNIVGANTLNTPLDYLANSLPTHGNLCVDSNCDTIISSTSTLFSTPVYYLSEQNYNGPDTFDFFVQDSDSNQSPVSTVTLTINPVNDPPVIESGPVPFNLTVDEKVSKIFSISDLEDSSLVQSISSATFTSNSGILKFGLPLGGSLGIIEGEIIGSFTLSVSGFVADINAAFQNVQIWATSHLNYSEVTGYTDRVNLTLIDHDGGFDIMIVNVLYIHQVPPEDDDDDNGNNNGGVCTTDCEPVEWYDVLLDFNRVEVIVPEAAGVLLLLVLIICSFYHCCFRTRYCCTEPNGSCHCCWKICECLHCCCSRNADIKDTSFPDNSDVQLNVVSSDEQPKIGAIGLFRKYSSKK